MFKYVTVAIIIHIAVICLLFLNGGDAGGMVTLINPGQPEKTEPENNEQEEEQEEKEEPEKVENKINFYQGAPQESVAEQLKSRPIDAPGKQVSKSEVSTAETGRKNKEPASDIEQTGFVAPRVRVEPFSENEIKYLLAQGSAILAITVDGRVIVTDGDTASFLQPGGRWKNQTYSGRGLEPDRIPAIVRSLRKMLDIAADDYGFPEHVVRNSPSRIIFTAELDNLILRRQKDAARQYRVRFEDVSRTIGYLEVHNSEFDYIVTRIELKNGPAIEVTS